MIVPTIHLNGTAREDLLQQVTDAAQAVSAAIDALWIAAPNGRDYYPQGADAMKAAQTEHSARVVRLTDVRDELQALAEAIADA